MDKVQLTTGPARVYLPVVVDPRRFPQAAVGGPMFYVERPVGTPGPCPSCAELREPEKSFGGVLDGFRQFRYYRIVETARQTDRTIR